MQPRLSNVFFIIVIICPFSDTYIILKFGVTFKIMCHKMNEVLYLLWQYGLWSFQKGDTKLEKKLPKNQHTQRKLLNFEFWIIGELSQMPKFDFQSQFSMSKIIQIFLNFFFIEEYQFRSTFFL